MAELFCGPGGLGQGALDASEGSKNKIKPLWANDIHKDTCETYAFNIHGKSSIISTPVSPKDFKNEDHFVIHGPVEEIDFKLLPEFDGLSFGFPCNDFSIVGEHKGTKGKYGPLYSYGVKAINSHDPDWFVAENVGGLQSANEGAAFAKILSELNKSGEGYNLTVNLYKFEEYGVPQKRHRIVIVGIRNDLGLKFEVPAPITPKPNQYITAKSAIENPPITDEFPNHVYTNQSKTVIERLKHIPPGENAWYEGIPEEYRLNVKGAKMSQIYRRLHPDQPSYTVTGSGGGGTHGYHWEEPRALTNRERARLQTFPDDFIFNGSKESIRRQIGMAVPVKGAQIIFEALLKTLSGESYKSVKPSIDHMEIINGSLTEKLNI